MIQLQKLSSFYHGNVKHACFISQKKPLLQETHICSIQSLLGTPLLQPVHKNILFSHSTVRDLWMNNYTEFAPGEISHNIGT